LPAGYFIPKKQRSRPQLIELGFTPKRLVIKGEFIYGAISNLRLYVDEGGFVFYQGRLKPCGCSGGQLRRLVSGGDLL
jgi:hypothetical protein